MANKVTKVLETFQDYQLVEITRTSSWSGNTHTYLAIYYQEKELARPNQRPKYLDTYIKHVLRSRIKSRQRTINKLNSDLTDKNRELNDFQAQLRNIGG